MLPPTVPIIWIAGAPTVRAACRERREALQMRGVVREREVGDARADRHALVVGREVTRSSSSDSSASTCSGRAAPACHCAQQVGAAEQRARGGVLPLERQRVDEARRHVDVHRAGPPARGQPQPPQRTAATMPW